MKERIQAFKAAARFKWQSGKLHFKKLWADPHEALLFRSLVVLFVFSGGLILSLSLGLFVIMGHSKSSTHVAVESVTESGGTTGAVIPGLGVKSLPDSVVARQDGIPEEGKDLIEPKISRARGLASISTEQVVAPYNPFVTFKGIFGSTAEKSNKVGRIAMDVSFEVDSHLVKRELEKKKKEITAMISSLVAEQDYAFLRQERGRLSLKRRIFDEVNFKLKDGKIKDVLYSEFIMR